DFKIKEMIIDIQSFSFARKDNEKREDFSLSNINFVAKRGQSIGIVGLSGSGKSTLFNILAANLIPQKGSITLVSETKNIIFSASNQLENLEYRRQVGLVSQDSHVF